MCRFKCKLGRKKGQIAHLNGNKNDNRYKNLVWLCFEHHDEFDSQTSQSKNYTRNEVEIYRDQIYAKYLSADFDCNEIERLRQFLTTYAPLFNYIQQMGGEMAHRINDCYHQAVSDLVANWYANSLCCFDVRIKSIQDNIVNLFSQIESSYSTADYHATEVGIIFTWKEDQDHNRSLEGRKITMKDRIIAILNLYEQLQGIAAARI